MGSILCTASMYLDLIGVKVGVNVGSDNGTVLSRNKTSYVLESRCTNIYDAICDL